MITGFYAGLLALIQIVLTMRIVLLRYKHRTLLGDAGNDVLQRRIRIHGNFIETVPLALILILILDLSDASPVVLHGLGASLVIARLLHAYGFTSFSRDYFRRAGMVLTVLIMLIGAILCIAQSVAIIF